MSSHCAHFTAPGVDGVGILVLQSDAWDNKAGGQEKPGPNFPDLQTRERFLAFTEQSQNLEPKV
ncbi:hypothetical protein E4U52_005140 [Claviceps spartinae]|nr:hypothetical protein E4U52_005140 [Claviceps spartinae]